MIPDVSVFFLLIGTITSLTNQDKPTSAKASFGSDVMEATDLDSAKIRLSRSRDKLCRYISHQEFMSQCLQHNVFPKGMALNFGKSALPNSAFLHLNVESVLDQASRQILLACNDTYLSLIKEEQENLNKTLYEIL